MDGIVSHVYETDECYHLVFNGNSTKAGTTCDSEDHPTDNEQDKKREFKLIKRDLYLENRTLKPGNDYQSLLNMMSIEMSSNSKSEDQPDHNKLLNEVVAI